MIRLILILLLSSSFCQAQEVISEFDDKGLVVLNDELKTIKDDLIDLTTITLSTTTIQGVLPVTKGGTNLTVATDDTVMVGKSASSYQLKALPNCTLGLTYTTSTNSFSCISVGSGLTLISSTTTSSDNTGDITIEASRQYYITFTLVKTEITADQIYVRFNSSATADGYSWSYETTLHHTTPTVTTIGDNEDDEIEISPTFGQVANVDFIRGYFFLDTNKVSVYQGFLAGEAVYADNSGTTQGYVRFSGFNDDNLTITSFELLSSTGGDFTSVVNVYELD